MTKSIRNKAWICAAIVAVVLVVDQVVKIWVKTSFPLGGGINMIGDWCRLYFVENEGIAFGLSFGDSYGKLILTLFRLVASVAIAYFLIKYIRKDSRYTLLVSITLILVGAIGNLVDSCFYGLIFNESTHEQVALLFPDGGGYGRFLYGRVVDMFYFPICEWVWPEWMPLVGGTQAEFFSAIFNVADVAVCVGVALFVVDQLVVESRKKNDSIETEKDVEKGDEEAPNCEKNDPVEVAEKA